MDPKDFISKHGDVVCHVAMAPYDPVKAHEYYIRNRHLKGRAPVAMKPKGNLRPMAKPALVVKNKNKVAPVKVVPKQKTAHELQAEIKARVAALEAKLKRLETVLADLVRQAKERSGVDTPTPSSKSPNKQAVSANNAPSKDLTSAQKREAAKKAKERYDKTHKKPGFMVEEQQQLNNKIKAVEAQIQRAREKLSTAVSAARAGKPVPVKMVSKKIPAKKAVPAKSITVNPDNYDFTGYNYEKGKWYDKSGALVGTAKVEDGPITIPSGAKGKLPPKRKK